MSPQLDSKPTRLTDDEPADGRISGRIQWSQPRLTSLGDLATLTRGGGGKVSGGMGDPGDNRKPFGQG